MPREYLSPVVRPPLPLGAHFTGRSVDIRLAANVTNSPSNACAQLAGCFAQVFPDGFTRKRSPSPRQRGCVLLRPVLRDAEQLSFRETWPQPQSERLTLLVDVNVVLVRDGSVLLGRRHNTGFEDGSLHLPAGHLEGGESVITALLREAWEELGIEVEPAHPRLVHVMHHSAGGGRLSFFFEVTDWTGEIVNREPHKCKALDWHPLSKLPDRIIPYTREALVAYLNGNPFSVSGWSVERSPVSRKKRAAAC